MSTIPDAWYIICIRRSDHLCCRCPRTHTSLRKRRPWSLGSLSRHRLRLLFMFPCTTVSKKLYRTVSSSYLSPPGINFTDRSILPSRTSCSADRQETSCIVPTASSSPSPYNSLRKAGTLSLQHCHRLWDRHHKLV